MKRIDVFTGLLVLVLSQEAFAQASAPPDPVPDRLEAPKTAMPAAGPATHPFGRDSYRIDPVICPFKGQIGYKPGEIECGLLEVPENREDPDSRFIELHFVKLHSRWGRDDDEGHEDDEDDGESSYHLAPGRRDDPVIYLTGGPGAVVTEYVKRLKGHGLLDHRDMYILEQRGIGYSGDFCPFYNIRKPALDDVATFEESMEAVLQRMRDCAVGARAAGVDISAYNTIENARDVKALHRALAVKYGDIRFVSRAAGDWLTRGGFYQEIMAMDVT